MRNKDGICNNNRNFNISRCKYNSIKEFYGRLFEHGKDKYYKRNMCISSIRKAYFSNL